MPLAHAGRGLGRGIMDCAASGGALAYEWQLVRRTRSGGRARAAAGV